MFGCVGFCCLTPLTKFRVSVIFVLDFELFLSVFLLAHKFLVRISFKLTCSILSYSLLLITTIGVRILKGSARHPKKFLLSRLLSKTRGFLMPLPVALDQVELEQEVILLTLGQYPALVDYMDLLAIIITTTIQATTITTTTIMAILSAIAESGQDL